MRISERLRSARGVEDVRHLGAVGGDGGAPFVAVRLQGAVVRGEPARPRVGDADDREAARVAALDRDDERRVVDPDRRACLEQLAGRTAHRGDEPDVAVLGVGDLRAVGRELRVGVLPVGHRVAAAGEPLGDRARAQVEDPDVRRVAVLDEHRARAVGGDGERARPLGGGDRLEPPVRRRLGVLAVLDRDALGLVLPHPDRHPCPPFEIPSASPASVAATRPPIVSGS